VYILIIIIIIISYAGCGQYCASVILGLLLITAMICTRLIESD